MSLEEVIHLFKNGDWQSKSIYLSTSVACLTVSKALKKSKANTRTSDYNPGIRNPSHFSLSQIPGLLSSQPRNSGIGNFGIEKLLAKSFAK